GDVSTLQLGEQPGDRETEAGAAQLAAAGLVDPEEAVEDPLDVLGRDAGSRVSHARPDHIPVLPQRERDAAARRVADRVGREVQEDVARAVAVAARPHGLRRLVPLGARAVMWP